MAMAQVMSAMPDMWRRVLTEHVADAHGHCRMCRNEQGVSATWPCATYRVAEQAKQIHDGAGSGGTIATGEAPGPRASSEPAWSQVRSSGRHAAD